MHRLTEQRWAGLFYIMLTGALIFQLIACVSPGWLRVFIRFKKYYKNQDRAEYNEIAVNQDYALWYMMQCREDTWSCNTMSYYQIAFIDESYDSTTFREPDHWHLERTNLYLKGVELRFNYKDLSEFQTEYILGMLACMLAWWMVYRHRKRLAKKNLDKVKNTKLIVAAVAAIFAGLFVLIPVGRFGRMGDRLRSVEIDHPEDITVFKPVGLGFGAAGGTLVMVAGIVIGLRLTLRGYCPDCVDLPQQDEISMRETANQIDGTENNHP